ncbi:hypothetical protein [Chryseobacterium sp. Leaf394]|uniref:hypothetical protein n=1 Tax=Chryseobacterium sp. Leaf394 TaxID=1736361 RepID=UPI0006F29DA0|nr:hypothetical protein [Chryseobacterium sp. Leaf394]KQS91439.1 hypothetical protein ASG21_02880 [Chryseobacterium sp. Leaf394]
MKQYLILFLFVGSFCFAQEKEIVKILNNELKNELKNQFTYPHFDGDTVTLTKEFSIDKNKILSVEIKKQNGFRLYTERQEVHLSKISSIGKDINIILNSDGGDVQIKSKSVDKDNNQQTRSTNSETFFTYLHFNNNEHIGNNLVKAFAKAGYVVKKVYWYD